MDWTTGMVDWIVFYPYFNCLSHYIYPVVFPLNFLNFYTYTVVIYKLSLMSHSTFSKGLIRIISVGNNLADFSNTFNVPIG